MTVLRTVRAVELTAAFSPQRKCKTVQFKSSPRNQKKHSVRGAFLYIAHPTEGYEPAGE